MPFKTDSEKAEEKQNQIKDALEREKEILDRLSELEQQYKDSLPKEEEPDLDALFPAVSLASFTSSVFTFTTSSSSVDTISFMFIYPPISQAYPPTL